MLDLLPENPLEFTLPSSKINRSFPVIWLKSQPQCL